MHYFSPIPGREAVVFCNYCEEVFPCCDSCIQGDCGHYGCLYDKKDRLKQCWCSNLFDRPVNNCPTHGKEYSLKERKRVKQIFIKRIIEKNKRKRKKNE